MASLKRPRRVILMVKAGDATDAAIDSLVPFLEPGDIVYVPNSPYTTLKRYINLIVNTFSATVAANEGIRAGGGSVGGAG